ncbi:MAG: transposase [Ktedonobacteraceae bacterium]|nr:transposase [Ktedonobacteraceae bacterium]
MKIIRGYKTELALNNAQITACTKHAGVARFAYNWGLRRRQEIYQQTGRSTNAMALHKELVRLKYTKFSWLTEVSKCAPEEALRDLDAAFDHFFERVQLKKAGIYTGKLGFPKYKSKKKGIGSFRLRGSIHIFLDAIQLPRLGRLRLKEQGYLPTAGGRVLYATVSEQAGRWFVAVQMEEETAEPALATGNPIGVDLGVSTLATCSDGRTLPNPKALQKHLTKLRRASRRLSRRKKGGKNRAKARKLLARQHYRISNIRRDALHKATSSLTYAQASETARARRAASVPPPKTKAERRQQQKQAKRLCRQATTENATVRPRVLVLEDLNVAGMKRNHKLARAISDVGMGEFRRQVRYKTVWNGETLLLADRWYPSTKRCSRCGHIKVEMPLSERVYVCEACGLVISRDLNAALNLVALVWC